MIARKTYMPGGDGLPQGSDSDNQEKPKRRASARTRAKKSAEQETPPPSKRAATERARRRRRGSLGAEANQKLTVPEDFKDANYHYRWVKSDPGRVRQLTVHDDYDVVSDEDIAEHAKQQGVGIVPERYGGTTDRGPFNLILVRKPLDYYEADQREKHEGIAETERGITEGAVEDPKGLTGDHAYQPDSGIDLKHGLRRQKAPPG